MLVDCCYPCFQINVKNLTFNSLINLESISRGYAEVYLPELLTSSIGGGCQSELLRCIPLEVKHHAQSTAGLVGGGVGGKWEHSSTPTSSFTSLAIRKPTVTAEVSSCPPPFKGHHSLLCNPWLHLEWFCRLSRISGFKLTYQLQR